MPPLSGLRGGGGPPCKIPRLGWMRQVGGTRILRAQVHWAHRAWMISDLSPEQESLRVAASRILMYFMNERTCTGFSQRCHWRGYPGKVDMLAALGETQEKPKCIGYLRRGCSNPSNIAALARGVTASLTTSVIIHSTNRHLGPVRAGECAQPLLALLTVPVGKHPTTLDRVIS